ncbi:MAG: hypothetical protein AAFN38_21800 [Cyanobacteria bacterium J06560_5]
MPINKVFLDKQADCKNLLDECARWKFDVLITADDSEGPPFQAVVAFRGDDTAKYLKAIAELEEELCPPDDSASAGAPEYVEHYDLNLPGWFSEW